jgi:hypothetical protein
LSVTDLLDAFVYVIDEYSETWLAKPVAAVEDVAVLVKDHE